MKTTLRVILCLSLALLLGAQIVCAVPLSLMAAGTVPMKEPFSQVQVTQDISASDAAARLYYLGLLSGTGVTDGRIDFALDRPLSRLESLVLLARMCGLESEITFMNCSHPFGDVPAWGALYVGYFWYTGLIDGGDFFWPDAPVSTNEFMADMLYALGFRDDYNHDLAAMYGEIFGICEKNIPSISRGDAVLMIFRTLNATMNGSSQTLSRFLVTNGLFSYQEAQFLLWETDAQKTEFYIRENGLTTARQLNDGKYTIQLAGSERCLNVAVDGANNDYEGVGVTVWNRTVDVTQKFRVEKTDHGTYRLFSSASNGGFNRLLGINRYGNAALFSPNSVWADEYVLRMSDAGDGSWYILDAEDESLALSAQDFCNGMPVTLLPLGTPDVKQTWTFEFDGEVTPEGIEFALYPSGLLCVTQGAYDCYSHQKQNALDISPETDSIYAPFTGEIVRIDRGWSRFNTVWLQSCSKVVYADGSIDYMTVVFMHDNNVSDLTVGQIIAQGDYFYQMGMAGGATGPHVHIACIRGEYNDSMSLTGSGDVFVEDALFLKKDTTVMTDYGLDWHYLP